jgi:TRAP-type uncharacterized transport system substrate-binding protein
MRYFLAAGALLILAGLVAAVYFWSPHATLRITTGPPGTAAQRFISAFTSVSLAEHPRVRFQLIAADDLKASAKALEDGKTDLAIVRTDVTPPTNGQTIAILRRDAVAFILPPKSSIESVANLAGKTVGIPQGPLQTFNSELLDTILTYYNTPVQSVARVFLAPEDMITAVRKKQVAVILAVGPVGPGEVVDAVAAVIKATHHTPTLLAFDDAETFGKRFPAFESFDVPEGAFHAHPSVPDDSVTTFAVTYRLVAPGTMLNVVAGAIGRSLFTNKAKLIAATPLASQIEAPDPDDKNPILPVHPGVANYLNSGEQSFFDAFQEYFYIGGIVLSIIGSLATILIGQWRHRQAGQDLSLIRRLVEIADRAPNADKNELHALDQELHQIAASVVESGRTSDELSTVSFAFGHARHAVDAQGISYRDRAQSGTDLRKNQTT